MEDEEIVPYYPEGVQRILAHGSNCYIGFVNDSTVLKYPLTMSNKGYKKAVRAEAAILEVVGAHERIIGYKGQHDDGLLLEYAPRGNLYDYVQAHSHIQSFERLRLCRELAEGVSHIHSKHVYHSDLRPHNILLDDDLHIKLADIQGVWKSPTGEILQDGESREAARYYMPRQHGDDVNAITDLFAVGSTIHFIMTGEEVFGGAEEIDALDDETIEARFLQQQFPQLSHCLQLVTVKCWQGAYLSATELLDAMNDASTKEAIAAHARATDKSWVCGAGLWGREC